MVDHPGKDSFYLREVGRRASATDIVQNSLISIGKYRLVCILFPMNM